MSASRGHGRDEVPEAAECRRVVILTATEAEARPILDAMQEAEKFVFATKAIYFGQIVRKSVSVSVALAVGGCDKANTAHVLTCLLQSLHPAPSLVLQTGIAGAFLPRQGGAGDAWSHSSTGCG
jgi:nucleoside phosphorylase